MTVIPIYRPYVFLRCKKCGRKTDHVLVATDITGKGAVEETYECQECGETKKIYELASLLGQEGMTIQELEEKVKAKRAVVEQLESKKMELEKRLKESQGIMEAEQKKDSMEAKASRALNESQRSGKLEERPRNRQGKRKRRFF